MKKMMLVLGVSMIAVIPAAAEDAVSALGDSVAKLQSNVQASNEKMKQAVVSDRTTTVNVALNEKSVKCSAAGYEMPRLKVLVPELAGLTVFNHRNIGEEAPCVASRICHHSEGGQPPVSPKDILGSGNGVDPIKIRVILKKETHIAGDVCQVFLVESVFTKIRGLSFTHERSQRIAEDRKAADCR